MKLFRACVAVLLVVLLLPLLATQTTATGTVDFTAAVLPENPQIGGQFELIVSLTGYTAEADAIRGIQIDVAGIDPEILEVVSCISLIEDDTAMSNTASYNQSKQRVRLAYIQFSGTLAAPCEDVLKVVFQVRSDLEGTGSITLPITMKIQTVSDQITLTSSFTIPYSEETVPVETTEILWGELDYQYSKGLWNAKTHLYEGGGWSDNGTGYVTVKNVGDSDVSVEFVYTTERQDVTGMFSDGIAAITGPVELKPGEEITAYLVLSGEPAEALSQADLGAVDVRIGGE